MKKQILSFYEKIKGSKKWQFISLEEHNTRDEARMDYLKAISTTRNTENDTKIEWRERGIEDYSTKGKLVASFTIPKYS